MLCHLKLCLSKLVFRQSIWSSDFLLPLELCNHFQIFFPASISCFVMKRNLIPWNYLPQNLNKSLGVNILSEVGRWRLAFAANCFAVPPIPSHGDFPWLVTKKKLCVCVCVPMPTYCTITCFGFCARRIDGIECGLFSIHAPLGQTTLHVEQVSV